MAVYDIISEEDAKAAAPHWAIWVNDNATDFQQAVQEAELEFSRLTGITAAASVTNHFKPYLWRIVRFHLFNVKYGDSEFKQKPRVITDYDRAIADLERGKIGTGHMTLQANKRLWGPQTSGSTSDDVVTQRYGNQEFVEVN